MLPDYQPPAGTTHVLEWVPPEIAPDFPDGLWDLTPVADFLNNGQAGPECSYEAGMTALPDDLGTWTAEELGAPVTLTLEDDVIGVPYGPFITPFAGKTRVTHAINRHWPARRVPRRLYWVSPA